MRMRESKENEKRIEGEIEQVMEYNIAGGSFTLEAIFLIFSPDSWLTYAAASLSHSTDC